MMGSFYQNLYIGLSVAIFFVALSSQSRRMYVFSMAIAVNIFPLMFTAHLGMGDIRRLAGIPFSYLPFIAASLSLIVSTRFTIDRKDGPLACLAISFVAYITLTSFWHGVDSKTLSYYLSWPFNFAIFLSAKVFFSKMNSSAADKVLQSLLTMMVLGCLIGLWRHFSGIADNPNFMPLVNRNGTVVFIIMISPLIFYMKEKQVLGMFQMGMIWILFFVTLILIGSRSGIIGFIFSTMFYYTKINNLRSIKRFLLVVALISAVFFCGIYYHNGFAKHLFNTAGRIARIVDGSGIERGGSDYKRYVLMLGSLEIIKSNFFFGCGVGMENYRRAFNENFSFGADSKAHIFYLSYLAELGVIGFTLLMLLLTDIYRKLPALGSNDRAFRVSFITIAVMMTMNEYILLPQLWFFFGLLAGISRSKKRQGRALLNNLIINEKKGCTAFQ